MPRGKDGPICIHLQQLYPRRLPRLITSGRVSSYPIHYLRPGAHYSGQGRREVRARIYARFVELPVPVVLVVLWLVGVILLSTGVLVLYLFASALVRMLLGT